jgi:hypothetical protein
MQPMRSGESGLRELRGWKQVRPTDHRDGAIVRVRGIWRLPILAGVAIAAYIVGVRPWHRRWGATHAITIGAPAGAIWLWLVQLGQNRGGFYSYELLENLAGCQMCNTDRNIPELQHLQEGDVVRLGPDPYPAYTVWSIQPERALLLRTADPHNGRAVELSDLASGAWLGTWAFVLDQRDDHTTRLLVRLRNQWRPSPGNFLVGLVVTEPAHFVMERKMLKTIKQLVERLRRDATIA